MSVPVKDSEPLILAAGDTVSFLKSLADYPATAGWQLKYELHGAGMPIEFTSTASGASHQVTVAASVTSAWLPGDYVLAGYAVNAGTGERSQIYNGSFTVTANLVADSASDIGTHAQKMIEFIESVMLGKAKHDILESEVEQTKIKRLSPRELREERSFWVAERNRELAKANVAAGRSNGRNRYVAFVDPAGSTTTQFGAQPPIYPFGR